ncbi:hypothetical protein QZH41_019942 [Actinostola sp. cb2023]|nr:hypothetical protein QZH41_019942 [Actinostola sp. cb2023]
MSADVKTSPAKEDDGRRVDLHTCSGETICLSFPENGTPLPQVIKLVDPDTGQSMVFQRRGSGYNEIAGEVDEVLSKLDFELCHNCRNEETNGSNELQMQSSGDERLDKQREKLQKKLRERKGSMNNDEDNCVGHCHEIIEIPVQGLSQIREDSFTLNDDDKSQEDDSLSIEQEKQKAEGLKIHKAPEVEVLDSTSMRISWSAHVSNNGHLSDCKFELQMAAKSANYSNIYRSIPPFTSSGKVFVRKRTSITSSLIQFPERISLLGKDKNKDMQCGTSTEHKKSDLKPGTSYRFRLCAVKDKIRGDYSPEAHTQTPSTAPDTPSSPYLANKTKTSFLIKWNAPCDNGSAIKAYILEWDKGEGNGKYHEIYNGNQRQHKVTHKLQPGTKCVFRVKASNEIGASEFSKDLSTFTSAGVPEAPDTPTLDRSGPSYLAVSWNKPECNGAEISEYLVEMEDTTKAYGFLVAYRGSEQRWKNEKLNRNTTYKFRVSAINSQGNSKWSEIAMFTTTPERPGRPSPPTLQGKSKVTSFTLVWGHPDDTGGAAISKYTLEMDDGKGGSFKEAYSGLECEQTINSLSPGYTYKLRVACYSEGGCSEWSRVSKVRTCPVCPGQANPPIMSKIYKPQPNALHLYWGEDRRGEERRGEERRGEERRGEERRGEERERRGEERRGEERRRRGEERRERRRGEERRGEERRGEERRGEERRGEERRGERGEERRGEERRGEERRGEESTVVLSLSYPPDYNGGASISTYMLLMEVDKTGIKEFREIYRGADNLCTVSGLHPGKSYSFCVRAANEAGVGKASNNTELSTAPGVPDAPRAPDTVCRSAAAIVITWEAPTENGTPVTGYTLEVMEDETFVEVYTGLEKTYELRKGVSPASYYYFRVKALSQAGASLWSAVGTCHTPAASPAAVSSVRVIEQCSSHLRLRWRHPANNGALITSYNIEIAGVRNISYDLEDDESEGEVEESRVQEYDVVDLQPNTVYRIRVQAVNKIGCGPFSPLIVAATRDLPPPAPALELASASYQSLKLRWGNSGSKDTVGVNYTLEMMDNSGNFHTIFNGSTTSHKVGKLRERIEYEFRIQASNEAGTGPDSDVYSFRTTAQPPSVVKGLRADHVTPTSFTVCWDPVSCVKRGDTIEYLLQSQDMGRHQDFERAYQGPNTSFPVHNLITGNEYRFRACAIRETEDQDLTNPDSPSRGLKGIFSPILTVKTQAPGRKHRVSESSNAEEDTELDIQESKQLSDFQWAMIFFIGFALFALGLAFIAPLLFELSG